jgi:hypothetical protein
MGSFMGVLFGIALFFGSFILLYWNEGRVDMSKIAMTAVQIGADAVDATANGKLVSVTGNVKTGETVGDGLYLKPGDWLALNRKAEMFAWEEDEKTSSQTNTGGSETDTTTYTYSKVWTDHPGESANFHHPEGHENPAMPMGGGSYRVQNAKIGAYDLAFGEIQLPDSKELNVNPSQLDLKDGVVVGDSRYLFKGKGSLSTPQLGDVRISYSDVPNGFDGTAFGKLENTTIRPFLTDKGDTLHRLFYGSRDGAIKTLATEYLMWIWIFRGIGFLMMFIGLTMVFGPISVFLDVLPIFGSISRAAVGGLSFLVSLVLSIVTILVSMLFHSLMAVLIAVVVIVVALIIWIMSKRKKAVASPAQP